MSKPRILLNSSFVLLNDDNTPGIFSIDFLEDSGIVPDDAEIEHTIQVPQFTRVHFDQGYKFIAQPNRTVLRLDYDSTPNLEDAAIEDDGLESLGRALVRATKHMRYKALGINFQVLIPGGGYNDVVTNLPPDAVATELTYLVEDAGFRIKISLKRAQRESNTPGEGPSTGIIFDSNFHHELDQEADLNSRSEQIVTILSRRKSCFQQLKTLIDETPI